MPVKASLVIFLYLISASYRSSVSYVPQFDSNKVPNSVSEIEQVKLIISSALLALFALSLPVESSNSSLRFWGNS